MRGRGRGKYICEECGIRCKKPSMLRKHIRTHSDVRPYHCVHCNFSFKTKGAKVDESLPTFSVQSANADVGKLLSNILRRGLEALLVGVSEL